MYTLILLSGGTGSRMKKTIPKQYLLLAGKPVIMHTLERIDKIKKISKVIIVCTDEYVSLIREMLIQYNIKCSVDFARAGETRQDSVRSGLELVTSENVILHEAARPFVSEKDFMMLINESCDNAIYGIKIPFTVVKGHENVEGILERSELLNVQLPQKFNTMLLKEAHRMAQQEKRLFTEDASLVYFYYHDIVIKICKGMDYNIKLTLPIDMITGEIIYKEYFARRK